MSSREHAPVALVTGGARRIGAAIVRRFAEQGWRLAIHCRDSRAEAEALLQDIGGAQAGHQILQQDLLRCRLQEDVMAAVLQHYGRLDCLVNNASVYRRRRMLELSPEQIQEDYRINFAVPFELMRLYRQACSTGNIINMLDQRVVSVDPGAGSYALAKKSLRDAGLACALEWAPRFRVNAVAPGIVLPPPQLPPETSMRRILQFVPMQKRSSEEEIAEACLFLAQAKTITGQIIYVDGGMHLHNGMMEKNPDT